MCWSKIKAYLRKRKDERELRELHERIAQDIQKRQARIPVATSRGGLNMPRFQSCPHCHANSQRVVKTGGGAYYKCRSHGEFFVRRERRRIRIPVHQHSK